MSPYLVDPGSIVQKGNFRILEQNFAFPPKYSRGEKPGTIVQKGNFRISEQKFALPLKNSGGICPNSPCAPL